MIKMIPIDQYDDQKARRYFDIFPRLIHEQISVSKVPKAGTLNVWHRHAKQTDWFFVVQGKLEVFTLTEDKILKTYILDNKMPQCLEISPGLYHGWRTLEDSTILIYCLSHKHSEDDEERVSYEKMGVKL